MNLAEQLTSFNLSECYSDLMFVANTTPRRYTIPACGQVVFSSGPNGHLSAGTYDFNTSAICDTDLAAVPDVPFGVYAKQLITALRAVGPTGRAEFAHSNWGPVLRLTNGDMTVTLTGHADDGTHEVAEILTKARKSRMKSRQLLEHSQSWLLNHLDAVKPAISTEPTRYYLNGICLQTDDQKHLLLTTTDGHRLHHNKTDARLRKALPTDGVIMDLDMLKPLSRLLDKKSNQPVTLRLNTQTSAGAELFAVIGNITLCGRTIDGKFPEWRRVVPEGDNKQTVTFDRAELIRALMPMPGGKSADSVVVYVLPGDKGAYLSVKTTEGYATRMRVKGHSSAAQPMTVGYNKDYLLAALRSTPGDTVTLTLFTAMANHATRSAPSRTRTGETPEANKNPAILRKPGTDDLRVLMPMRISDAETYYARTGSLEPEQTPDVKQAA